MSSQDFEELEYEGYEDIVDENSEEEETKMEIEKKSQNMKPASILRKKGSTIFVTKEDIKQLIKQKCQDISELMGVSDDEAILLFTHFKWRRDLLESDYFGDEENVRKKAGIEPEQENPKILTETITCMLCFDEKPADQFESLTCNHYFCKECWGEYVDYHVKKLENTFFWKCPQEGCSVIVPHSFNLKYIKKEDEQRYYNKMAISYADYSKSLRWCTAPNCDYGAEVETLGAKCIECFCGTKYCFKCGLEDHRPCDCSKAAEWMKNDDGNSANDKWLLMNTKNCPKCNRPIEKNQGCNFMKCRQPGCAFEFCWLCLGDWKTHSSHFACNKFDNLSQNEKQKLEDEKQSQKKDFDKYLFYYERYINNNMAVKNINQIRKKIKDEEKDLSHNLALTLTQLSFLDEGCLILGNTKKNLKWSYAYGFDITNDLQRNMYEVIQEKMDMYSSQLHVLFEKDFETAKSNIEEFRIFKEKVQTLVFQCKQSSEVFLEKMEDFENVILEEELKDMRLKEQEKEKEEKMPIERRRSLRKRANPEKLENETLKKPKTTKKKS